MLDIRKPMFPAKATIPHTIIITMQTPKPWNIAIIETTPINIQNHAIRIVRIPLGRPRDRFMSLIKKTIW